MLKVNEGFVVDRQTLTYRLITLGGVFLGNQLYNRWNDGQACFHLSVNMFVRLRGQPFIFC